MVRLALALALLAVLTEGASARAEALRCAPDQVTILTGSGPLHFQVEIADEPEEQARGLMFRPSLAPDAGMLFVFDPPRRTAFWMRNTMIPLDMIFVDDAGRIETIVVRRDTFSDRASTSKGDVRAVLELNAGTAAARGIREGDRVIHPAFRAAPEPFRCPAPDREGD